MSDKQNRKRKAESEPVVEDAAQPDLQITEEERDRKERKRLKKERKERERAAVQEQEEASVSVSTSSAVVDESEPAKSKKSKKSKHSEKSAEEPSSASFNGFSFKPANSITKLTQQDVDSYRADANMTISSLSSADAGEAKGENEYSRSVTYRPLQSFDDVKASFLSSGIAESESTAMLAFSAKFQKPTPIQAQCWPVLLSGHDAVCIAETGSGKTLGFSLPALVHLRTLAAKRSNKHVGADILVLSPTRELAMQIAEVTEDIGKATGSLTACVYGGVDKGAQLRDLAKSPRFIVATPGRLLGLLSENAVKLDNVTFLVLDEADRMLDMGFEPDVRRIVQAVQASGKPRQTVMFRFVRNISRLICFSESFSAIVQLGLW